MNFSCAIAGVLFMALALFQPWEPANPEAAFSFGLGLATPTVLTLARSAFFGGQP